MSKLDIPVFVHVPKTAGTTFRVAVEQYLGAGAILWDYGAESPVTSPVVRQYLYQEKDVDALRQAVARYRFVSGHFNSMKWKRILPDSRLFAFLRDPVQRVASLFNHMRTHDDPSLRNISLHDWVQSRATRQADNHQVRIIGSVNGAFGAIGEAECELAKQIVDRKFEFVGITERFDESFLMIREALGWDGLFYVSKNTLRPSVDKGYELDARTVALIRDTNRWDVELYEHALRRFDERITTAGDAFAQRLEQFRRANARHHPAAAPAPTGAGLEVAAAAPTDAPAAAPVSPAKAATKGKPRYRGRVQQLHAERVTGWAMALADPEHPVIVELLVNGALAKTAVADRMRKGVKERQIHPTGLCGFVFQLGEAQALKDGDEVAVRVKGSKALLGGTSQVFTTQQAA
jgi:hypothetical protein